MQNSKLDGSISSQSILRPPFFIAMVVSLTVIGSSVYTALKFQDRVNQRSPESATVLPEPKTVTALGRIEPRGKVIKLSATTSPEGSRVREILVQEGDRITAGQVIAILDSRDSLLAALKEAEEQVKVELAKLNRIKAGAQPGEISAQKATIARLQAKGQGDIAAQKIMVARLQAEVRNAEVENQRYEELYQEGAISASQRDSKGLRLETAQKNLQEAQTQLIHIELTSQEQIKAALATLDQIAEVPKVDIAAAEAEVSRAIAAMKRAQVNVQQAYVRSPQGGQIFEIHSRPGELISSNGIADIGETTEMYVVAEVYESDIGKVHPGQKVQVFGDFLPIELQGTVDRKSLQVQRQNVINTDPASNIDNRVVEVYIRLDQTSSQKAANLTNMQVKAVIQLSNF
ncbi:ABC exporter membrane fusion protein [Umezakia ovalisporum]|uniref:ABC exporter membrane fusion protein n=2 Tax=Umezakia ovalisporum TaxID=75695 RepID=A0AA43KFU5_9CYAN|nr:ABC exporter membrane fusion protein [Umezakia ovalisporum]MDH6058425.1 ABC exporter membrane fusion protein [Umezakia ovalisporum FSS-43]MDH6065007.1 ABC exporter membrane fusion protein [Umezakia ovalisporum FSS-62]MDH6067211.1 ABC exporter membrane fusion protein [Umezakia ovalisporum APH033B]MDH6070531.1 ABC exporter membrane fusion protein [Umezakia ovalisporum CobakiLakeA]MDH6074315.1 ABC exporter membrane fusion protein [Umezakia ovalisporum CS-1034]